MLDTARSVIEAIRNHLIEEGIYKPYEAPLKCRPPFEYQRQRLSFEFRSFRGTAHFHQAWEVNAITSREKIAETYNDGLGFRLARGAR
jgi:hypothetical protein